MNLTPQVVPPNFRDMAKCLHRLFSGGVGDWMLSYNGEELRLACEGIHPAASYFAVGLSTFGQAFANEGRLITLGSIGLVIQRPPIGVVACTATVKKGVWQTPPVLVVVEDYPDPTTESLSADPDGNFTLHLRWRFLSLTQKIIVRP